MKNEQQSQNLLLKVDPRSTFRNNFLQLAAKNICWARSSSREGKNAKHRPKTSKRKQCCASWAPRELRSVVSRKSNYKIETQVKSGTMTKMASFLSKGGEIRDTKTLNLSCNIVSSQAFVDVSRFSPCVINLSRNKNICCGLKKVVAKSRARVYFEQQILALLLVFHQTHNLSRNKSARALANQPISAPHFFNPQQMFLLPVKLITQGEKRETSTKTCNETMLRDKLTVFVSRISPP